MNLVIYLENKEIKMFSVQYLGVYWIVQKFVIVAVLLISHYWVPGPNQWLMNARQSVKGIKHGNYTIMTLLYSTADYYEWNFSQTPKTRQTNELKGKKPFDLLPKACKFKVTSYMPYCGTPIYLHNPKIDGMYYVVPLPVFYSMNKN